MLLNWGNSQGLNALMNSAEFIAGFADKGSGEVDLVLSRGTGSATFTRATTATTVDSAGTIISVASGTPRSYYDPTTLQYLGYLAEGARTNLHPASADMTNATYWSATRASWPGTAITAPNGTSTGQKLVEDSTAANTHLGLSFADVTVVNATTYTTSVFAKAGERTWFALQEGQGVTATAYFNLSTGVVGTVSGTGTPSATIKAYPNGWYRCTLTWTASGVAARIRLFLATADSTASYSGDGTSGAYFWGAQVEAGSFASTYIPTTTASVPRNADVLTYPTSGNVSGTVGTIYGEMAGINDTSVSKVLMSVDGSNSTFSRVGGGANTPYLYDGAFRGPGPTIGSPTSLNKLAFSWGSSSAISVNGSVNSGLGFDGDLSAGANMSFNALSTGANNNFGTIRNVRIYQTQLSASQLQAVTS